jgi:hypothetical protein
MKITVYIILISCLFCNNCFSQNSYTSLDSLESIFEVAEENVKMPCRWIMTAKKKPNGKLTFFNADSMALEFDFFKAEKLPFFTPVQTEFETVKSYLKWKKALTNNTGNILVSELEEDENECYIIYKVKDTLGEYHRILSRHGSVIYSIKIFDKKQSVESQLANLKLLHSYCLL